MDTIPVEPISGTQPDRKRRPELRRGDHDDLDHSSNHAAAPQKPIDENEHLDDGPIETFFAHLVEHDIESAPDANSSDGCAGHLAARYEEVEED